MSQSALSDELQGYGTFALRIVLGGILIAHALSGLALLSVSSLPPDYARQLLTIVEAIVGIALALGFKVRWVSLLAVPVLLASFWLHAGAGWLFPGAGGGREVPLLLAVIAVVQFLLGEGPFALSPSTPLRWREDPSATRSAQAA